MEKKSFIFLAIIVVISLLPRLVELFGSSHYFGTEQGVEYLVTKNIVIDHKIVLTTHQGGFGGFSKPTGYNYLLIIPFILANGDPYGGRIFMFFLSEAVVIAGFIVATKLFSNKAAIIISFLLSISPALSHYAGRISPPFVMPLISVVLLYFFYKSYYNKFYIVLLAFIIGVAWHFEPAASGTLGLLFFPYLILLGIRKKISPLQIFLSLLFFLLAISPLFVFDINHNFYNTKGIIKMLGAGKSQASNFAPHFMHLLSNRAEVFRWNFQTTFSPHILLWPFIFIVIIIGSTIYLKDSNIIAFRRKTVFLLLLTPILTFFICFLYPGDVVQWWLAHISVFYCFLFGEISSFLLTRNILKNFIYLLFIGLFMAFLYRTFQLYKREFLWPPNSYIIEIEPLKMIFEDSGNKPFGLSVISYRPLKNYEYLTWWLGSKYGRFPYHKKKGLYYILVDADYNHKAEYERELSNIKGGRIVGTQKTKNRFIIQKRIF